MNDDDVLDRLAGFSLSPQAEAALGLSIDLDPKGKQALVEQGLWWIQPLFRARLDGGVGLALLPDTPLEQAPVVLYKKGVACTVASTIGNALPMLVYRARLVGLPDVWAGFRQQWDRARDELRAFAAVLGDASTSTPDAVYVVAQHEEWITADEESHRDHEARAVARSAILRALDPSDAHCRYRTWLDEILRDQNVAPVPVEGFGAWTRQAEVAAFLAAQQYFAEDWVAAAAWNVTRGPASLDTSQAGDPDHVLAPVAMASQGTVREAADELLRHTHDLPDEIRSHPAYGACVALLQEGRGYTGLAHVKAASLLDDIGLPADAYHALISASFWSYVNLGQGFEPAARAARMLAEHNGWDHVARRLARIGIEAE
jgi:hypothetical protein